MKCPYIRSVDTHIQGWTQSNDSDSQNSRGVIFDQWQYVQQDCLKDQCGVWRDGRCCYAAVSLEN